MKAKLVRPSSEIRLEIQNVDTDVKLAHVRHAAAKLHHADLSKIVAVEIVQSKGWEDMDRPENNINAICAMARCRLGTELVVSRELIGLIESTQEYQTSLVILAPLLAEFSEAVEREESERHAAAVAEQERLDRITAAKAEAFAKIEAEFAQ